MRHFPVDVPKSQAIKTLERLGFRVIRDRIFRFVIA
jgi:predicted RNA binding protein YcfA (HicA-like mRNA interferase family)